MADRRRPGQSRPSRQQREAQAAAKLDALHGQLASAVHELVTGEDWRRALQVAARFRSYSFRNTLLIALQRPDATRVAGYTTWHQLGRQVDKGEKGLQILAPVLHRPRRGQDAAGEHGQDGRAPAGPDPTAGHPTGNDSVSYKIRGSRAQRPQGTDGAAADAGDAGDGPRVVGYRPTYVWDVSQTSGDPLPQPPAPQLLAGDAPGGLASAVRAWLEGQGFPVRVADPADPQLYGANGVTDFDLRTVTIRSDLEPAAAAKTLIHEAGHVLLHDPTRPTQPGDGGRPHRGIGEVEAESVAFLVAATCGLPTGDYSFPYVASWADAALPPPVAGQTVDRAEQVAAVVLAAGTRAVRAAGALLEAVETALEPAQAHDRANAAAVAAARAAELGRDTETLRRRAERLALAAGAPQLEPAGSLAVVAPQPTDPPAAAVSTDGASRDALTAAAAFYASQLPGSWAAFHLRGRGLDAAALTGAGWCIGFAPPGRDRLIRHLLADGHTPSALVAAGLARPPSEGRGPVDVFRDRLVIAVCDPSGQVVGFTGRAPDRPGPGAPRWLNSPASSLYDKSALIVGLHEAAAAIAAGARPVLVEGAVDAFAVTSAGLTRPSSGGAPATVGLALAGTALTRGHLELLADVAAVGQLSGAAPLLVAFDGDLAGRRAASAAYELTRSAGMTVRQLGLPDGADPAQLLAAGGPEQLADRLASRDRPLLAAALDHVLDRFTVLLRRGEAEGRVAALRAIAPLLAAADTSDVAELIGPLTMQLDVRLESAVAAIADAAAVLGSAGRPQSPPFAAGTASPSAAADSDRTGGPTKAMRGPFDVPPAGLSANAALAAVAGACPARPAAFTAGKSCALVEGHRGR